MPQMDPLENIMGMLRRSGSIDPAQAAQRKAQMKPLRRQMGIAPGAQQGEKPAAVKTQEEGMATNMSIPQRDMTPVIVDQLNETIISIKLQVHREVDPERRVVLEQQAEGLRQQILSLGGEPIWADESVEEGILKLKGYGFVGEPVINDELQRIYRYKGILQETPQIPLVLPTSKIQQAYQPVQQERPRNDMRIASVGTQKSGEAQRILDDIARVEAGRGNAETEAYFQREWGGIDSYIASQQARLAGLQQSPVPQIPDVQPPDRLSQILEHVGEQRTGLGEAPESIFTPEKFDEMRRDFKDTLRTPGERQEEALARARGQFLPQQQRVYDQIASFEESWPREFEKVKGKIEEQSAKLSADIQEESAARGMFYSSIMAGNMIAVDEKELELIADVATRAQEHLSGLQRELRDLYSLEALQRELHLQEMRTEDRETRFKLAEYTTRVALEMDKVAFNNWRQTEALQMEQRAMQLDEIAKAIQLGQEDRAFMLAERDFAHRMQVDLQKLDQRERNMVLENTIAMENLALEQRAEQFRREQFKHEQSIDQAKLALDRRRVDISAGQAGQRAQMNQLQMDMLRMEKQKKQNLVWELEQTQADRDAQISLVQQAYDLSPVEAGIVVDQGLLELSKESAQVQLSYVGNVPETRQAKIIETLFPLEIESVEETGDAWWDFLIPGRSIYDMYKRE